MGLKQRNNRIADSVLLKELGYVPVSRYLSDRHPESPNIVLEFSSEEFPETLSSVMGVLIKDFPIDSGYIKIFDIRRRKFQFYDQQSGILYFYWV